MAAAITGCTTLDAIPALNVKMVLITTPDTADSADTLDVSSATVTGGPAFSAILWVSACDSETGDAVTATWSSTTIIIDAAGGTTDKTYRLLVIGTTA